VSDAARIRAYPAEAVLTKAQVAEWLQVSTKTVERLGIPRIRLGYRTPRYLAKHVLKFLDNGLDPAHRFLLGLDRKGGHDD
jgi:hypothetical protein